MIVLHVYLAHQSSYLNKLNLLGFELLRYVWFSSSLSFVLTFFDTNLWKRSVTQTLILTVHSRVGKNLKNANLNLIKIFEVFWGLASKNLNLCSINLKNFVQIPTLKFEVFEDCDKWGFFKILKKPQKIWLLLLHFSKNKPYFLRFFEISLIILKILDFILNSKFEVFWGFT